MKVIRFLQVAYIVLVVALFAWTLYAFRLPDGTIDSEGRIFLAICLRYIALLPFSLITLLFVAYGQLGLPFPGGGVWLDWVLFLLTGILGYFQWFWLLPLLYKGLKKLGCRLTKAAKSDAR